MKDRIRMTHIPSGVPEGWSRGQRLSEAVMAEFSRIDDNHKFSDLRAQVPKRMNKIANLKTQEWVGNVYWI